jgi:hypothetical protein
MTTGGKISQELPQLDLGLIRDKKSYYSFGERKLLFVNVESDFARIAPLIEAALAYGETHEVFFLDLSKHFARGIFQRINSFAYDCFRGGNLIQRIQKYLTQFDINVIRLEREEFSTASEGLLPHEELSLKLAIRNQNIDQVVSIASAQKYFDKVRNPYAELKLNLENTLSKFGIDRVFVWNGRFELSTVVALAAQKQSCPVTKIEWGSRIDESFEVFREPPRNRCDAWARANQFQIEVESGGRILDHEANLNDLVNGWRSNRFTSRFREYPLSKDLMEKGYIVFFTSSFWESATYGKYVSEIDRDEVNAVTRLIGIARDLGFAVVVRVHPNPWSPAYEAYESALWKSELASCPEGSFSIIDAGSEIDSYDLAVKARCVFTVWSTIGFECLSRNIPTFFVADFLWESYQNSQRLITDSDVIAEFIESPQVLSLEKFRYFLLYKRNYGFRFRYLVKLEDERIYFLGKAVAKERENLGIVFGGLSKIKRGLLLLTRVFRIEFSQRSKK